MTTVHVYPDADLIEHDTDGGDCICGPDTEFVQGDDTSGFLLTHHALDGRN